MASDTNGGWYQAAELGSAWGLNFLYGAYRLLGRWPLRLMLLPVLAYFYAFKPAQRRASKEYLARLRAMGILSKDPGALDVLRHFFSFAEAIVDKVIAFNGGFRLEDVELVGREAVKKHLDAGQGMVFVSAHLGNLEVCRVLSQEQKDLRLQVLVHTRHAENFNRLLKRLNPGAQVNLHQVSELGVADAAWLSDRVSAGECVVIAGDRSSTRGARHTRASFLGAEAEFAQGPWVLASLMDCPVFLLFCVREGGRYHVYYEPFAERIALPRSSRDEALRQYAARYAARLEHYCEKAPFQWFNFFPFWQTHDR